MFGKTSDNTFSMSFKHRGGYRTKSYDNRFYHDTRQRYSYNQPHCSHWVGPIERQTAALCLRTDAQERDFIPTLPQLQHLQTLRAASVREQKESQRILVLKNDVSL